MGRGRRAQRSCTAGADASLRDEEFETWRDQLLAQGQTAAFPLGGLSFLPRCPLPAGAETARHAPRGPWLPLTSAHCCRPSDNLWWVGTSQPWGLLNARHPS